MGRGARALSRPKQRSEAELGLRPQSTGSSMLERKVFLDLRVKVAPDWFDRDDKLTAIGYTS